MPGESETISAANHPPFGAIAIGLWDVDVASLRRHLLRMAWTAFHYPPRRKSSRPVLDMTLEGDFVQPPTSPLAVRVMGIAILVAVVAGAFALAALLLYLAFALIPVALAAAAVAYGAYLWQRWRARRASFRGLRDLYRP
jgi:hypothetical protein